MRIPIGIENNNDHRSIAWALEHPGLFAYGADAAEAKQNMREAAEEYASWVQGHGMKWMDERPFQVVVEETFDDYPLHENPEVLPDSAANPIVEAVFQYDAVPLSGTDVERALKLLGWGRQELLDSIQGLTMEQLNERLYGERWSIDGILLHVGHAEWWYQACVSPPMPPQESDLPEESLGCLELVRAHLMALIPKQEAVHHLIDVDGETWSFRKMLRRAAWHERDHTRHILKLRSNEGWDSH